MKGYKEITEEIINRLREGTIPWRQHWHTGLPANAITKKPYRGINTWLLSMQSKFQSNLWLTYNQCKELGGYVRKGEHGRAIVFWKILEIEDQETNDVDTIPMLRLYTVFNIQQTSIEMPTSTVEFNPIVEAQMIVDGYIDKPPIITGNEPVYPPVYFYRASQHKLNHKLYQFR